MRRGVHQCLFLLKACFVAAQVGRLMDKKEARAQQRRGATILTAKEEKVPLRQTLPASRLSTDQHDMLRAFACKRAEMLRCVQCILWIAESRELQTTWLRAPCEGCLGIMQRCG